MGGWQARRLTASINTLHVLQPAQFTHQSMLSHLTCDAGTMGLWIATLELRNCLRFVENSWLGKQEGPFESQADLPLKSPHTC